MAARVALKSALPFLCMISAVSGISYFGPRNVGTGVGVGVAYVIALITLLVGESNAATRRSLLWRAMIGVGIVYSAFLAFLCTQPIAVGRGIFAYFDPSLTQPEPEREYASDCSLIATGSSPYQNLLGAVDVFVFAHTAGFAAKMIILRDWRMALLLSVGFEQVEIMLQHILPNFRECWWDHIVADILICNGGGMLLGMLIMKVLRIPFFDWFDYPHPRVLPIRFLGMSNKPWTAKWSGIFTSVTRLLQVAFVVILMLVGDTCCFFLKNLLHQPPSHPVVISRLVLWGYLCFVVLDDYYVWINLREDAPLPFSVLLGGSTLGLELLLSRLYSIETHSFTTPMPDDIFIPLISSVVVFALWAVLYSTTYGKLQHRSPTLAEALGGLWWGFVAFHVYIFVNGLNPPPLVG